MDCFSSFRNESQNRCAVNVRSQIKNRKLTSESSLRHAPRAAKRRPGKKRHQRRYAGCGRDEPVRHVARVRPQRGVRPAQRQHRKHCPRHLVEKLLQNAPQPAKPAGPVRRGLRRSGHASILAQNSSRIGSAPITALKWAPGRCKPIGDKLREAHLYRARRSPRMKLYLPGEAALQLDDHLKNLLRELGHAINDTVSESERITGAIAGVRAHGYDIVLKLDATIGLARRDADSDPERITPQDRRFLESLRIQVDQELEESQQTTTRLEMTPQDIRFLKSLRIAVDDLS